jgi:hypothetical protein
VLADLVGTYVAATPPPAPGSLASIAPATVHVAVENGSGEAGMGAKMAAALRKLGFVVDSVGNADSFGYDTTVIREHSKVAGVGERVRQDLALKSAAVTPAPSTSPSATAPPTDVTVVVGRDFVTALAAQPAASSKTQ